MKTVISLSLLCAAEAFSPSASFRQTSMLSSSVADEIAPSADDTPAPVEEVAPSADEMALMSLKDVAAAANPIVNYYDPLNLAQGEKFFDSTAENIGWLRQAEIKHGRVAMAAFVGYCVQSQYLFPGVSGGDVSPEVQWDQLPTDYKWGIILLVGALELFDEADPAGHYTKGRDPGRHPAYQRKTNRSAEQLAEGRIKELNNGRLAMLGIMGFVSSSSVPGSVPLLSKWTDIAPYTGNFWAPFSNDFSLFESTASSI